MNNKGKIIRLLIAIIIPLLAAVFIANYSYNWEIYRNKFEDEYMQKGATAEEGIENFIKFDSYLYEKEAFLVHQYKDETGKALFDLKIIRTISLLDDEPKYVGYKFFIYNVDYESLIHLTEENVKEKTPRNVTFKISLVPEEASPHTMTMKDAIFTDFNTLPEHNQNGEKYMVKYNNLAGLKLPSNLKLMVYKGDLNYDEDTHEVKPKDVDEYTEFINLDLSNFTFDADELNMDNFTEGLNRDVLKAGFGSYIFKTKIWWQVLVTLVVVGFISFSFLVVWEYEQQEKKNTKKN